MNKIYYLTGLAFAVISALPFVVFGVVCADWRQYNAQKAVVTIDHQMIPTYDTVEIKHYHKVDNKVYVITSDSLEMWVDNIQLIYGGKK